MPLNFPGKLVMSGVLALAVTYPPVALVSTQGETAIRISEAMASSSEAAAGKVEYVTEGNQRILRVRGMDLNHLHETAYREFIRRIGEEIKKPGAQLTIADFKTSVRFENGQFVFEYKVNLNPAQNQNEVHTLVDMRGTVLCEPNAEDGVLKIDSTKIPEWQGKMNKAYSRMKIWYETAHSSSVPSGDNVLCSPIFHEAVLAKGAVQH
ncbi:MAG: hypothetical protein WC882_05000 [Candidatus Gracilibacteria bacterium]